LDQVIILLQKISTQIEQGNIDWIKTIISTIIGLIVGTFLSEITQRIGKVKIECNKADQKYYKNERDKELNEILTTIDDNPAYAKCYTNVTMYNTSKNRKILKNINVEAVKNRKRIEIYFIFNKDIGKDKVNIINIEDKSIKEFEFAFKLDKKVIDKISDSKNVIKIYLHYRTEAVLFNNRKYKLFELWK